MMIIILSLSSLVILAQPKRLGIVLYLYLGTYDLGSHTFSYLSPLGLVCEERTVICSLE